MIYMREKATRKKRDEGTGKDERNKSVIEELKSKLMKKSSSKLEDENRSEKEESRKKQHDTKDFLKINNQPQRYKISKANQNSMSQHKFSESIIIHDMPDNANPLFSKKTSLSTVKCFDIQILNDLSSSRYRVQAYIQLLQQEKQLKNREIKNLKELLTVPSREETFSKDQVSKLQGELTEKTLCLSKYQKYFQQGKNLYLSVVMQLIDTKNELNIRLSQERKKSKQKSINTCIEKIERLISMYSSFIQFKLKNVREEVITIDELWNNVKYHEKIIEIMKENELNYQLKTYHHENTLLRYEINRLSQHNQELLKLIGTPHASNQHQYAHESKTNQIINKKQQESIMISEQDSEQIEEEQEEEEVEEESQDQKSLSQQDESYQSKQETPFHRLKPHLSPSIQHPFSNLETDNIMESNVKLQKELNELKSKIKNLQVEKEYVVDELQQLERSKSEVHSTLKAIMQQNAELKQELNELKNSYEVSKQSEKVLEEQNELLKDKMKLLFKTNGKETATVEQLLKLLNRKELLNYHQALMELINRYEQRVSELTNSIIYEREFKQYSLTYCKGLFNLIQLKSSGNEAVKLQTIVNYVNQYQDIMAKLKENEIDVYLRKIKSFSIGIDEDAVQTIKEELKDYVQQLQSRLPTLSEQYFEDGSSIADSYHNSIQRFE